MESWRRGRRFLTVLKHTLQRVDVPAGGTAWLRYAAKPFRSIVELACGYGSSVCRREQDLCVNHVNRVLLHYLLLFVWAGVWRAIGDCYRCDCLILVVEVSHFETQLMVCL
jgi:hypothetical protein